MKCNQSLSNGVAAVQTDGVDLLRRLAPVLGWLLALVGVIIAMQALGSGALAAPDLAEPGSWSDWVAERTAPEAAVAVLRLLVLVLAWYLLVVTVLAVVLRLGSAGRLVTVADVVTLPFVRSLVQAGVGVGLAGAAVAGIGAATSGGPALDPPGRTADVSLVSSSVRDGDAVMQLLPPEGAAPVMQKLGEEPASPPAERTWTVQSGDHLWSVAERVLTEAWQRPPSDEEVAPYWEQVVEHNRSQLPDPGNPDLLFPGQVVAVPTPPPAP